MLSSPRSLTLLAVLLLAVATACGAPGLGDSGVLPGKQLPSQGSALLVRVDDARDAGDREVAGSASSLAVALRRAFQARGFDLWSSEGTSRVAALGEAAELQSQLVVVAELTGWNEAGLEWRDQPDRVELRLSLYAVPGGELLAWGQRERVGGSVADKLDKAHRMLEPLVTDLLDSMFDGDELSGPPGEDG